MLCPLLKCTEQTFKPQEATASWCKPLPYRLPCSTQPRQGSFVNHPQAQTANSLSSGISSYQFILLRYSPHPEEFLFNTSRYALLLNESVTFKSHTTKSGSVSQSSVPSTWLIQTARPAVAFHICNTIRTSSVTLQSHVNSVYITYKADGDAIRTSQWRMLFKHINRDYTCSESQFDHWLSSWFENPF